MPVSLLFWYKGCKDPHANCLCGILVLGLRSRNNYSVTEVSSFQC